MLVKKAVAPETVAAAFFYDIIVSKICVVLNWFFHYCRGDNYGKFQADDLSSVTAQQL